MTNKSTRQKNEALQFISGKAVVAQFVTFFPQSYGWLRHRWKSGALTIKALRREIKRICNG
jgi:hypothetical protein